MRYFLGFDGGGTKTECALLDDAGNVRARATTGPSNPRRIGFAAAFSSLRRAASAVLSTARIDARQVRAVCAGLAGAGSSDVARRVAAHLESAFPESFVHVTTDQTVALEAAAGAGPGVVLIAGTGSAAYGRNTEGKHARAGGRGPWAGDEGSAFDIGRRAFRTAERARSHRGPATQLAKLIPAALDCRSWKILKKRIAESPDEIFPSIFPLVVEAAEADDGPARAILAGAARDLAQLAAAVIRRLGLGHERFVLAKVGGVFGHSKHLDSALDERLARLAPRARIARLSTPPAVGAARLAQRLYRSKSSPASHGAKA